ncbi:MAG: hypothetical protein JWP97_1708 [Labilithrix sp.]|nr:hypothetical protein [Labilithrix sp.]
MKRRTWIIAAAAWVALVAAGFGWTFGHAGTPGHVAAAPARFPATSTLPLEAAVPTLVVFAHPRCACTRATLHELEWIVTRTRGHVRTYVVFARPPGAGADWQSTTLHAAAKAMDGVTVIDDDGDALAHAFGATSSGQVVLYAPSGELLFSGGITLGRGHEGANAGRDAVLAAISRGSAATLASVVFGCALDTPEKRP